MEDLDFCQDSKLMLEYGVISRRGPRNNITDCEVDIILIHVPTGKAKRFHGTFYDKKYAENMCKWIRGFPKSKKGLTVGRLNYYYTCYIDIESQEEKIIGVKEE